ncbi:MAG: MoxR family ATPase [Chloroflexi bacterium]|nr:MoxR family ATPase [Chloroflexota bacterium]
MVTPVEIGNVLAAASRIRENVERVIVGKDHAVTLILIAILCEGHVLIEDVPGIGKTTLAKAIARSLGCTVRRIQSTPDLLPSDVTGTHVFNQKTSEFEFRPGPIMAQLVLIDEINRATPRTQSALLEAMEERQITVDGETMAMPRPFLVLATQNPIELEGTFPLPEAQIDRFLIRIKLGYPSSEEDREILTRLTEENQLDALEPVLQSADLLEMQRLVRRVHVAEATKEYVINLAHATRSDAAVELGASPRAMVQLFHAAQARAAVSGREYVQPDDVKAMAPYVLSHRIVIKPQSRLRGGIAEDIVDNILESVPVPVEQETQVSDITNA